jgi:hypothetical protein
MTASRRRCSASRCARWTSHAPRQSSGAPSTTTSPGSKTTTSSSSRSVKRARIAARGTAALTTSGRGGVKRQANQHAMSRSRVQASPRRSRASGTSPPRQTVTVAGRSSGAGSPHGAAIGPCNAGGRRAPPPYEACARIAADAACGVRPAAGATGTCGGSDPRTALVSDDAIIGLLESRLVTMEAMGKERVRLLATLLIDPAYRGLRLSRVIFDEFMRSAESSLRVLVRFRDSNRKHLERLYRGLGFSRLEADGEYGRSKEKR